MKFKRPLLILAASLLLVGCGGNDSSSSGTTEDSAATVVSSEPSEESVPPSSEDSSTSENSSSSEGHSEEIPIGSFKGTISILQGEETEEKELVENSGAYHLTVNLENLPSGKSLTDCIFTFPKDNAHIYFQDESPAVSNKRLAIIMAQGKETIEVEVTCGSETIKVTREIEIKKNKALYTTISTPDDFFEKVLTATEGRFELGANLDLGGRNTDAVAAGVTFNGILDGNGHTIKNFNANPGSDGTHGGLWAFLGSGLVTNLHLIGEENQTKGFGGLIAGEMQDKSLVDNCLVEVTSTVATGDDFDWTWCRSGGVAGVLRGEIRNSVLVNAGENLQVLTGAPYAGTSGRHAMTNIYSNVAENATVPFIPDPNQDWCGNAIVTDCRFDVAFSDGKASDYNLDSSVWTLVDGKTPALAHDGEDAVISAPSVSAKASKTSLVVGSGTTSEIIINVRNAGGSVVSYGYTTSDDFDTYATASLVDNVIEISPIAAGSVTITPNATVDGNLLTADPITITIKTQEEGGEEDLWDPEFTFVKAYNDNYVMLGYKTNPFDNAYDFSYFVLDHSEEHLTWHNKDGENYQFFIGTNAPGTYTLTFYNSNNDAYAEGSFTIA